MISTTAGKPLALSKSQSPPRKTGILTTKKIWLPKLLYDALPYFYLTSGFAAFFATMYISEWFWILPHYLLFSAACLHLGVVIYRRRQGRQSEDPLSEVS
jgi:hypothetical protein